MDKLEVTTTSKDSDGIVTTVRKTYKVDDTESNSNDGVLVFLVLLTVVACIVFLGALPW